MVVSIEAEVGSAEATQFAAVDRRPKAKRHFCLLRFVSRETEQSYPSTLPARYQDCNLRIIVSNLLDPFFRQVEEILKLVKV
jgi:hypothetical protein